jgi:hypothetical protein
VAVRPCPGLARRRRDDPFRAADTELARRLGSRARFTLWPGEHEAAYVERHFPRTLRVYANALAACRT